MKTAKRVFSLFMAMVMLLGVIPLTSIPVFAGEAAQMTIGSVSGKAGGTVDVVFHISNAPSLKSIAISNMVFDTENLELVSGEWQLSDMIISDVTVSKKTAACAFSANTDCNGDILVLKFKIADNAKNGSYTVSADITAKTVSEGNESAVAITAVSGSITVVITGDLNGDGEVNSDDAIYTLYYTLLPDLYPANQDCDFDSDGEITSNDAIYLLYYTLLPDLYPLPTPAVEECQHTMTETAAHDATCTEDGNIAYWYCDKCNKYFSDENGKNEITCDDTVIAALGHAVVIDPAVEATYEHSGLTQGSHCSRCKQVLTEQSVIPQLTKETGAITYIYDENDTYLCEHLADVSNPNPDTYTVDDGLTLSNNVKFAGYTFTGWYDGPSDNATKISKIESGTTGSVELFAHFEKVVYSVTLSDSICGDTKLTYTVDEGTSLGKNPEWSGYRFVGWSDSDGEIIKSLPIGTTGNIKLEANWISERNKAWTKNTLDAPMIIEDNDSIFFVYEIGKMENVPIYVIEDFGFINSEGVTRTISKEYTVKTSETLMEQYANTVTNATTNSAQWALSDSWSKAVNVNQSYLEEQGISETDARTICTTDGESWLISSGSSGSDTTTKYDSSQVYDLNTTTKNTKTYDIEDKTETTDNKFSAELDFNYENKTTLGNDEIGFKNESGFSIGANIGYEREWGNSTATKTGTEKDDGDNKQEGSIKHTGTDTVSVGGWNNSESHNLSQSVSDSTTHSKTVSERICSEYGYGESYINAGSASSSQGLSSSTASSDSYSSSVTYNTEEIRTESVSYTTTNTKTGYHRLIKAGTAHIFAVVGYDIKTASYYVTTYSVMDDEMHDFEDYSYTSAAYDDYQSSVIPFEVPYEVEEYVLSKVGETEGLEFNSSGVVTGYTGSETLVIIPEYHVVDNLDGSRKVLKVTGLNASAFKDNTSITGIELSDYITEIPATAFSGCTSLELIQMAGVTSIGSEAFHNCNIDSVFLSKTMESLGDNAFDNIEYFALLTDKYAMIEGAINSGAEKIYIYQADSIENTEKTRLEVPSNTEVFVLHGCGNVFEDMMIDSNADLTIISNLNVQSKTNTPLRISSPKVQLGMLNIETNGFALMLTNASCELGLYGESCLTSNAGKAVLCKNVNVYKMSEATSKGVYSELEINGNIYVWGDIQTNSLVNLNGEIIEISEEEYTKYLSGMYTVSFNANGGIADEEERNILVGNQLGTLPVPTKNGFNFLGWFTDAENGTEVTSETVVNEDMELFAHWAWTQYSVTWETGTGYSIVVTRTASNNPNANIGTLSNGAIVYLGDTLSVSYTAGSIYKTVTKGAEQITVTGNVTKSQIYMTVELDQITYNVNCYNASGTLLSSYTEAHTFGTTNTITPPYISGYDTPCPITVKYNTKTIKTIEFIYTQSTTIKGWEDSVTPNAQCYADLEVIEMTDNGIVHCVGWVVNSAHTSSEVTISDNGNQFRVANIYRSDINSRFGVSGNHGFDFTMTGCDNLAAIGTDNTMAAYFYGLNRGANFMYSYTISYDANGGSGTPPTGNRYGAFDSRDSLGRKTSMTYRVSYIEPTRDGYTFVGWSTTRDGAVKYLAGSTYCANSDATLYAVWEANS